jgi:3-hydroxyisobutyrate dehydrogenase
MRSIGVIGLGQMGVSIARRLIAAGYPLTVYNRTKNKADSLLQMGASWADSPGELVEKVDVTITIVSDNQAIEKLALDEGGFLNSLTPAKILIEMSTLTPATVRKLFSKIREKEAGMLHCPILGGPLDVYGGRATICAGGPKSVYTSVSSILEDISSTVHYVGEITKATVMKLSLNIMLTHYFLGVASSLSMAKAAKLPPYLIHDILTRIAEPVVQKLGDKILNQEESITFTLNNFEKDQRYFLEAAAELGVHLPTNEAVQKLALEALDKGMGNLDFSSLAALLLKEEATD